MKEDIERRERAQAALIDNQAKRLDELETLYKARPPLRELPQLAVFLRQCTSEKPPENPSPEAQKSSYLVKCELAVALLWLLLTGISGLCRFSSSDT